MPIQDPAKYAHLAVDVADEGLANDIVMLDVREVSDFADFFVVMTAQSTRQIESLMRDLEEAMKSKGGWLHHREGTAAAGWVLLDFSDVIVHILRPEEREYYQIEEAWSRAKETVRIQ